MRRYSRKPSSPSSSRIRFDRAHKYRWRLVDDWTVSMEDVIAMLNERAFAFDEFKRWHSET